MKPQLQKSNVIKFISDTHKRAKFNLQAVHQLLDNSDISDLSDESDDDDSYKEQICSQSSSEGSDDEDVTEDEDETQRHDIWKKTDKSVVLLNKHEKLFY